MYIFHLVFAGFHLVFAGFIYKDNILPFSFCKCKYINTIKLYKMKFTIPKQYAHNVSRNGLLKCGARALQVKALVNKSVILLNGDVMEYESILITFSFIAGRKIEIGENIRVIK